MARGCSLTFRVVFSDLPAPKVSAVGLFVGSGLPS